MAARCLTAVLLVAMLASACSGDVAQEDFDRVVAERDALVTSIGEAEALAEGVAASVEAADPAAAASYFSERAVYEDVAEGVRVEGRYAIEGLFGYLDPEQPIINDRILAGPGFVVTEWHWELLCTFGTCSRQFGEQVTVRGITLQIVEGGEITETTDYIAYSPGGY